MSNSIFSDLPKVELHCHLELALRRSTLRELATEVGLDVATDAAFDAAFLVREPMASLPEVLHKFLNVRDVLRTREIVERITYEICKDFYLESNCRILELRYAPSFLLDVHPEIGADGLLEAIERGVHRAETEFPMAVGLIVLLQRIKSAKENQRWLDFALANQGRIVGVDLADNEVDYPPEPFIPLFQKARKAGLGVTIHAGEPAVEGIAKNIAVSIQEMGAHRIGHGLQAIHDPEVIALLVETGTPLELCPVSNWLTQAVPTIAAHPIRRLMEAGVKTTINTDDPGIMCTDLNREYELLVQEHGFTRAEFQQCNQWAFETSFIDDAKKRAVWEAAH